MKKDGIQSYVESRLAEAGMQVTTLLTSGSGDATKYAKQAVADNFDMVIAAGGDGTINETATALCDTGMALGIIPVGSGNGLARHLNIPMDVRGAVEVIASGSTEVCDHGSVNDIPFFCTFGIGFDAAVSREFAKSKRRGRMSYISNTFRQYLQYKPEEYVISANGEILTERAFVVAVCNASQYGNNAYIAPHATMKDGLLDVTIIHAGNLLTTALVGVDLMAGSIDKNMLVHTFRTKQLTISRSQRGPCHIDGEPMMLGTQLDIKCHEHSLKVFTHGCNSIQPLVTPVKSMVSDLSYIIRNIFEPLN